MNLLEALKSLREAAPILASGQHVVICGTIIYPFIGICHSASNLTDTSEDNALLQSLIKRWPGGVPGNPAYPVGGHYEYTKEAANKTIWANPRRTELLNWMIHELEHMSKLRRWWYVLTA